MFGAVLQGGRRLLNELKADYATVRKPYQVPRQLEFEEAAELVAKVSPKVNVLLSDGIDEFANNIYRFNTGDPKFFKKIYNENGPHPTLNDYIEAKLNDPRWLYAVNYETGFVDKLTSQNAEVRKIAIDAINSDARTRLITNIIKIAIAASLGGITLVGPPALAGYIAWVIANRTRIQEKYEEKKLKKKREPKWNIEKKDWE